MLPTAELARTHTDPRRTVGDELFERVYDRDVKRLLRPERTGEWWAVDVQAHADRVVRPDVRVEAMRLGKTICLCHDVEAGLGHVGVDEELVRLAERDWRANVTAMLAAERDAGVRATYNVVGSLLPEVRAEVEAGGHCLAFHSFSHDGGGDQLARCREVDYRLKGYRAPRSHLTSELRADRLLFHNFEWLASSAESLATAEPTLRDGLVNLPVHFDDFPLFNERDRVHGVGDGRDRPDPPPGLDGGLPPRLLRAPVARRLRAVPRSDRPLGRAADARRGRRRRHARGQRVESEEEHTPAHAPDRAPEGPPCDPQPPASPFRGREVPDAAHELPPGARSLARAAPAHALAPEAPIELRVRDSVAEVLPRELPHALPEPQVDGRVLGHEPACTRRAGRAS